MRLNDDVNIGKIESFCMKATIATKEAAGNNNNNNLYRAVSIKEMFK